MEIRDLLITPIFIFIVFMIAYGVRNLFSGPITQRYFIPGLALKVIGGIAVGLIYQFYYGGGDTFNYFNLGSKYVYEAFKDKPILALKLIFAGVNYIPETFEYATKIYTYGDPASYFVVRVAGALDILTFHTYSATTVLFAAISFSGLWALFTVFVRMYPDRHLGFAIGVFFIPSVFFWGSGILKDTITIGALGWAVWGIYCIFFEKRYVLYASIVLAIAFITLFIVKIYILMCFLPAAILWVFYSRMNKVKNVLIKIMVAPVLLGLSGVVGYYAVIKVGEDDPRYDVTQMGNTAKITAEWIHYVSELEGGSSYTLGDFDFSTTGIIKKFPRAVWVTLYRPYVWEAHNIVMLLSAVESFALLIFTLYVLYKVGVYRSFQLITSQPILTFCFLFSIVFAFAVGISSYNFGTLVRYKIPLYPLYVAGLVILLTYTKKERKRGVLAEIE